MQDKLNNHTDRHNYNAVDLFKFLCSILVVMIHAEPFGAAEAGKTAACLNFLTVNYFARIAVPFFFIASGFFLYKKTAPDAFDFRYTEKYVGKTFRLYIIWTLIYFPMVLSYAIEDEMGLPHAALIFFRNAIFTGTYGHLWYLAALMFAVLLVSLLLCKGVSPKKIVAFAAIFYFFGLFAQSWFGFILPLKSRLPWLWNILKLLQIIIVTTRDGLFEAFLFVSIGMCFAFYGLKFKLKGSVVLFALSMLAMLGEALILEHLGFIRKNDMYFFLVPAVYFMFSIALNLKLKYKPIYLTLRKVSALVFYSHFWARAVVFKLLSAVSKPLTETPLLFSLTLAAALLFSIAVIYISDNRNFKWLKRIYGNTA